MTNFLDLLNESKEYFHILLNETFGIVLSLERHQGCNYRFKTTGKFRSHHLKFS